MSDDCVGAATVSVDLSRVDSSLAAYSLERRQEAIKAIERVTARVARQLVYSVPDLGWQVVEREGAFTVHYMAFEDLIVFLAISTGYEPPFERWEAFCLKRDGMSITIRIDGIEKGPSARAKLPGIQPMQRVERISSVRRNDRGLVLGGSEVGLPALSTSEESAGKRVTLDAGVVGDDLPLGARVRPGRVVLHPACAVTGAGAVLQADRLGAAPMLPHHQQRAAVQLNICAIVVRGDLQASAAEDGLMGSLPLEDGRQAWPQPAARECRYAGMLVDVAGCHLDGGLSTAIFAVDRQAMRDISASAHIDSVKLLAPGKQEADVIADRNAVAHTNKMRRCGTYIATKQVLAASSLNDTWERALFGFKAAKVEVAACRAISMPTNREDGMEDLVMDRAVRCGHEVTALRHYGVSPNDLVEPHENSKLLTGLENRAVGHPSSMFSF